MKAKIYVGAKKYALYIGRKIVQKTLEFLTLPATFVSKKVQELKNLTMWGQSVQNGTPTPTAPVEIESVGDRTINVVDSNNTGLTGRVIDSTTGNTVSWGSAWTYIDYTDIKPNANYTFYTQNLSTLNFASNRGYAFYDENKAFISGGYRANENVLNFTTPSNAKYLRISSVVSVKYSLVEGTYTASNVPPYEPYGYKVPVEIAIKGQNIFNKDKALLGYTINAQGVITPSDTYNCSNYVSVEYGKTYIRLNNTTPLGATYHLFNSDKVWLGSKVAPSGDGTMVIDNANCKYIVVAIAKSVSLNTYQIIEGSTPKPYEPYQYTTTNIYLNEPLRKIGDYADTMSVDGTDVTVVRNVGSATLDGSETIITIAGMTRVTKQLSPSREKQSEWSRRGLSNYGKCGSASATNIYIEVDQTQTWFGGGFNLTPDNLRTLLTQNNCISYYPLATPTTETYTIDNPIQLEQGTLTIDIDTNVKPSKINITGDIDNE